MMQSLSNEQLCVLAQKGDTASHNLLLENNMGFIHKTANELFQSMGLANSKLGVEYDDLIQEGSIGLLNAINLFDVKKGIKFLTYAAPAIRNTMMDLIRSASSQFEQRISDGKDGWGFQIVRLNHLQSGDEKRLRIEAIDNPYAGWPDKIFLKAECLRELYEALEMLSTREQTYLLYRYGFTDDIEHPLSETAKYFHLSKSRAKKIEEQAMDNLWLELPWWF